MIASRFAMTLIVLVGLGVFAWTARRRWRLMFAAAAPDARFDQPALRWRNVLRYLFGQARMFRYPAAGVAHALIFGGFVVLLLRALILYARGFTDRPGFGFGLFDDDAPLGQVYLLCKDLVGVLVVIGVAYFLWCRLVSRPRRMEFSTEGVFILLMILGIVLSDMGYEAAGYLRTNGDGAPTFHALTPAASLVALALRGLPEPAVAAVYHGGFWLHAVIVIVFLNFLPYGKHFHVLTVLPNVYFSNLAVRGIGRLAPIEDIEGRIERGQTLGTRTLRDLSWKDVLDLYTCTECGRCSDHCPAFNTGKLLSPKHLTMDLRDHLYRSERALLARDAAPRPGAADATDGRLVGEGLVINPEVVWACTTCGACEQECPVFISYVDKIVGLRRHLVMEAGEFPEQLQTAFRGMESVGNPYSSPNEQRADWAAGLDVPLISDRPDAEVLLWVGCAPAFDDRSRRVARATAALLKAAGVEFAILGPQEHCTGDPARRAGNEFLFQTLARQNVETLNGCGVRRIVTVCPHCFNTLRNEYPAFGGRYEVVHHAEFLRDLVRTGRLRPARDVPGTVTFHDSCYLGRYNGVYDAPRELLRSIPGLTLVEPRETRDRGMCCGAGGAQVWKEEEKTSRQRVNHARTEQLLRVLPADGPRGIATACPFCKTMIGDALRDRSRDDVEQLDVAEWLLRAVGAEGASTAARSGGPADTAAQPA